MRIKAQRSYRYIALCLAILLFLSGCGKKESDKVKLTLLAASSLENVLEEEIIPLYEKRNPSVTVAGIYDGSGRLRNQIEQGLEGDVFWSAAVDQMDRLDEREFIVTKSRVELIQNELVLIARKDSGIVWQESENFFKEYMLAIGDPAAVPAGNYAKDFLIQTGCLDYVEKHASYASSVTQVLNWVLEGSAQVGIVYASDVEGQENLVILANLSKEYDLKEISYPAALLQASANVEQAREFLAFLQSEEVREILCKNGFSWTER